VPSAGYEPSSSPPGVFRLTAHPVRWRVLCELGRSDRQVRELTALVGEQQSLVSYHLSRLRAGGLVRTRRSSADGRDTYYIADLQTCVQMLSSAAAALHPGLGIGPPPPTPTPPAGLSGRVLFLCTGNSARSQMAEALLQHRTADRVEAFSAGSHPTRLHPDAVRVMRTYGVDLAGRRAKHFDVFDGERFDYVVTLCDRVREVCPEYPGSGLAVHWSMANPAEEGDSDRAGYAAFDRTAAEISARIDLLVPLLSHDREET
jgi:protein-tyrosine-phosphatase/DNA-binding transcriptional ArsR family regulator